MSNKEHVEARLIYTHQPGLNELLLLPLEKKLDYTTLFHYSFLERFQVVVPALLCRRSSSIYRKIEKLLNPLRLYLSKYAFLEA